MTSTNTIPLSTAPADEAEPRRARLSAEHWFIDHTFIPDDWMEYIYQQCVDDGALPIMNRHPKFGWVFHTLCRRGVITTKEIAKEFPLEERPKLTERQMEDEVCKHLESLGIGFERQVPCEIGIADVVTDTTVYELKLSVWGSAIFTAVGQVLAYRRSLGPARAVILTTRPDHKAVRIGKLLRSPVLDYQRAIQNGVIR
jgi:hypothetical protein